MTVDVSAATQVTQLGLETVYGTPVAATKRWQGISIDLQANSNADLIRPDGYKHPTIVIPNKEWSEMDAMIVPDYEGIVLPLSSALKKVTPTGGGTAKTWVFDPASYGVEENVASFTVERGNRRRARRSAGVVFTEIGFDLTRDKIGFSGKAMGLPLVDNVNLSTSAVQTVTITGGPSGGTFTLTLSGQTTAAITYNAIASAVQSALEALSNIGVGNVSVSGGPGPGTPYVVTFTNALGQQVVPTMTAAHAFTGGATPNIAVASTTAGASPTEIASMAMMPGQADMYIDNTAANLGVTQLARGFSFSWKATALRNALWAIKSSSPSYASMVESTPTHAIDFALGADNIGMGLMADYTAGVTKFVRVKLTGPAIPGGGNYSYQFDCAVKLNKQVNITNEQGLVLAARYTGEIAHDATWGKGFVITAVNTQSSL